MKLSLKFLSFSLIKKTNVGSGSLVCVWILQITRLCCGVSRRAEPSCAQATWGQVSCRSRGVPLWGPGLGFSPCMVWDSVCALASHCRLTRLRGAEVLYVGPVGAGAAWTPCCGHHGLSHSPLFLLAPRLWACPCPWPVHPSPCTQTWRWCPLPASRVCCVPHGLG